MCPRFARRGTSRKRYVVQRLRYRDQADEDKKEIAFGKKRMELEGRESRKPYTRQTFKDIFSSWHIYCLTLLYM